jgi:two-component system, NarL family, sensor kinase
MAIEARAPKRKQAENSVTKTRSIPKMELVGRQVPKNAPSKPSGFDSVSSLIKTLGEFNLITDVNETIVGFWASRSPSPKKSILGRPLTSFVQPDVASEIRALADRTTAGNARAELERPVRINGVNSWFSVSAMPLRTPDSDRSALCLAARNVTHRVQAMQTLADREALLAKAEEIANFGSYEIDLKTNKVKLSPQLRKLFGLSRHQKWSRDMYWTRMHPSDRVRVQRLLDGSWEHGQPVEYTSRYCAADGSVRVHLTQSLPMLDDQGVVVRGFVVIHDITEQAKSHQELRRLSHQLMNEQDSQRRHLARELHESAGQSLASLKMTLGRLREAVDETPELVSDLLDSADLLADGAICEVRTVTHLLHPPMLDDAGLGPALRWYSRGFTERSGICATLAIVDPFPRLSQDIETTVFRVVQEALTNVHRYSGSDSAEITVRLDESKLYIEIRDRGCGFPPAAEPQRRTELGVGISGMHERVKQLNGDFEISSVPGRGTTVRAVLPAIPVKPLHHSSRLSPRAHR